MDSAMPEPAPAPAGPAPPAPPSSIAALLPAPAHPPPKRTDTVALKLRLAELLDPDHGQLYWTGLADFVVGRINRHEWDEVMRRAFGADPATRGQALKLHNALLLSILYNTTRPFLPPSSVRHSGFHPRGAKKRALAGDGLASAAEEKRRRLVKDAVMALGRRERSEVKHLGSAAAAIAQKGKLAKEGAEAEERRRKRLVGGDALSEAVGGASRGGGGRVDPDGVPRALREREREGANLPPTLPREYGRLVQLPLCCESRLLPDAETLRERMLAVAYEEGMVEGVEARTAGLVQGAIENHLKNMIASVISLVRGTRQASPPPLPRTASSSTVSTPIPHAVSTFAPAGASATPPPTVSAPASDDEGDEAPTLPERTPLTIADFHALFAISPSLLGQYPTSAAVQRMYAIGPPDSDSSSDEDEDDHDHDGAHGDAAVAKARDAVTARETDGDTSMATAVPPNAAHVASATPSGQGQGAGKHPRLSRSRASSFYGATRPVRASAGGAHQPVVAGPSALKKPRFVLDPSSTHGVPSGHPDVPHLRPTPVPLLPLLAHLGGPVPSPAQAPAPALAAAPNPAHGPGLAGGAPAPAAALSPKSLALRNSLFPELAPSAGGSGSATPAASGAGDDGNATSTDAGSDSDDDAHSTGAAGAAAHAKRRNPGLKIKLGSSALAPHAAVAPGGGRAMPTNERDKEAGRKLWEVVDSVGLLDGVLQ
ncbi:hypothetical protein JCM3770_001816 [Rhodotorula araucariae]